MGNVLDLLQCPICGTFYKPETTTTGRTVPHCALPVEHGLSRGQLVEWTAIIEMNLSAFEARIVERYRLTEGVVGRPLTGSILDVEV